MRVVLGVAGGIAAYKAVLLLRLLKEAGHEVRVLPTAAALKFVGAPTWEALAGHPVTADVFHGTHTVDHVRFGQEADLVIVAPATANLLAQAATGQACDLLTSTLLVTGKAPVLMAPAMHTEMWEHPATVANVAALRARGVHVLDPDSGRLTGADSGPGRLPDPQRIFDAALHLQAKHGSHGSLAPPPGGPLAGRTVVVSAGGTQEPLDPVRFIANRSSGRQGVAIARAAARAGAHVELVACNVDKDVLPTEPGITATCARTTADLEQQMNERASADVIVMVAAVADFRPKTVSGAKIKTNESDPHAAPVIELVRNPDILKGLTNRRRPGQVIVGFGAETGDGQATVEQLGRRKAIRKEADLLAVNEVGETTGFGDVPNRVILFDSAGRIVEDLSGTKDEVAEGIVAHIAALIAH